MNKNLKNDKRSTEISIKYNKYREKSAFIQNYFTTSTVEPDILFLQSLSKLTKAICLPLHKPAWPGLAIIKSDLTFPEKNVLI